MAISQAYSDLIYLFLDGEATETERSVLFSALKEHPELQEEFASAVQVKGAFVTDALKIQPPTYIEGQIAEKTGLLASKLAGGSAASSALTTAPTVATPFLLKVGLLLLGGAAAGVIATVAINNNSSNNASTADRTARNTTQNIQSVQSVPTPSVAPTQNESAVATPNANSVSSSANNSGATVQNATSTTVEAAKSTSNTSSNVLNRTSEKIADAKTNASNNVHSNFVKESIKRNALTNEKVDLESSNSDNVNSESSLNRSSEIVHQSTNVANAENTTPVVPPQSKDISDHSQQATPIAQNASIPESRLIEPALVRTPGTNLRVGTTDRGSNPLVVRDNYASDWTNRLSVSLLSNTALAMYPSRNITGLDNNGFNRYGINIGYDLAMGSTVGIEFNQETFPMYLKSNDGRLQPHYSMTYGALSYQYIMTEAQVLNVHPFARVLAGVATPGPIAKLDIGATLQFEHIGFSLAPEYTVVAFKNNGSLTTGSKLGLMYTMTYHF